MQSDLNASECQPMWQRGRERERSEEKTTLQYENESVERKATPTKRCIDACFSQREE